MVPLLLLLLAAHVTWGAVPQMVSPSVVPRPGYSLVARLEGSAVWRVTGSGYEVAPYLVRLRGNRTQVGYHYAALLHQQTSAAFTAFYNSLFSPFEQQLLNLFLDFCWDRFLQPHTPQTFVQELQGMADYHAAHPGPLSEVPSHTVARRFYTVANMPADPVNIIAMLEEDIEPSNWPSWLKDAINDIIKILEKIKHGCDSYGVWGSRTQSQLLFTSRNLDWNTNTGIDGYKAVIIYEIDQIKPYASIGFTVGLGALAGISSQGITVSEMNLDNNVVTFFGSPFPLRLRTIMEQATDLVSAEASWNAGNNTNSFNFMIGASADGQSRALETIRGFTQFYGANSSIEAAATFYCDAKANCKGWTNQTGVVHIGKPLPEAVWRTNHAFSPVVMKTQEPLFNDTVFRYNLMHDLFAGLTGTPIDDRLAVQVVATLGTKGRNFLTCNQDYSHGENVMSIAYAPGDRSATGGGKLGYFYVAWEEGKGSKMPWVPAACRYYVRFDFDTILALA